MLTMREFDLLQHVYEGSVPSDQRVEIPPGDDMAMLRLGGSRLLAAVDQVVDGRHFRLESTSIELIGRKAITRSLSDIAAMAGRPVATLAAVVLPPDFGSHRATALFDAMRDTAAMFDCPLVGGDIAFHADAAHPLTCSVTVLAEPGPCGAVRRSGARVGDMVYVTGSLGGSLDADGGGKHLSFTPRINEAIELAERLGDRLHAMIDISDGLGRDASHIAERSGVCIQLYADRIPVTPGATWRQALSDGEDYELCFVAAPDDIPNRLGETRVTPVGEIIAASTGDDVRPLVAVLDGNLVLDATECGWQHIA